MERSLQQAQIDTLEQIICLGQQHPDYESVQFYPTISSIAPGNYFLTFNANIFIKGEKPVMSGMCLSEEEMFQKLQSAMDKRLAKKERIAA